MGFNVAAVEFLSVARDAGVSFDRTLMLGRQSLDLGAHDRERLAPGVPEGFAEPLLVALGAREVRSLDASGYEGATDVHDLNEPVPVELHERFSAVIDGGTLEHVFNYPEALRSAMRMIEPGGHLLVMTPCNDSPGHGFYQVSPELLFRVLSEENGFEVERFMIREERGPWYEVLDPAIVGQRCEFTTNETAYLYVVAQRTAVVPVFGSWPQQSDYTTAWVDDEATVTQQTGVRRILARSDRLRSVVGQLRTRSSFFTRVSTPRSLPRSYKRRPEHFTRVR